MAKNTSATPAKKTTAKKAAPKTAKVAPKVEEKTPETGVTEAQVQKIDDEIVESSNQTATGIIASAEKSVAKPEILKVKVEERKITPMPSRDSQDEPWLLVNKVMELEAEVECFRLQNVDQQLEIQGLHKKFESLNKRTVNNEQRIRRLYELSHIEYAH